MVSWDLIPVNALANMSLMPGSNPLFGLNTLGGAISLQTKRGYTHRGGAVELSGGSWDRYNAQAEYGGVAANGVDYFMAGNYFDENGWRDGSPSEVRRMFGQLGWRNATTDLSVSLSLADNDLIGNGLVQKEFLRAQDWEAINTASTRPRTSSPSSTSTAATGWTTPPCPAAMPITGRGAHAYPGNAITNDALSMTTIRLDLATGRCRRGRR